MSSPPRRCRTRKARRREQRAAHRHGFDDLNDYRAWRREQHDDARQGRHRANRRPDEQERPAT